MKIKPDANSVLIVVDVQNCFMPGGSLAVKRGDEVVPIINKLAQSFQNVVITQDWHHPQHVSFASQHSGKKPFEQIELPYGPQVLWPDHCVQGTEGASLHKDLSIPNAQLVIRKGFRQNVDSYSAFVEADRKTPTGLGAYLNVHRRPGNRLLRCMDRARRAERGLRCHGHRRRFAWHRPERFARKSLVGDEGRRCQARAVR